MEAFIIFRRISKHKTKNSHFLISWDQSPWPCGNNGLDCHRKYHNIQLMSCRHSNRTAFARGDHVFLAACVGHIRAETLQLRISHWHSGKEHHARRLQPAKESSNINLLSPSFHIREASLFTIQYTIAYFLRQPALRARGVCSRIPHSVFACAFLRSCFDLLLYHFHLTHA